MYSTEVPSSAVPGIVWPAIPAGPAAQLLAVLHHLDQSQWWPPEELQHQQFRQLGRLVEHAFRTVPFYRARLAAAGYEAGQAIAPEFWRRLPILTRREVQEGFAPLTSRQCPASHGRILVEESSGSTSMPIKVLKTELAHAFWSAFTLRHEIWHPRDWSSKFAAIRRDPSGRSDYPAGSHHEDWGFPLSLVYRTGPAAMLDIRTTIEEQVDWLIRENPDYLLSLGSNLLALALHFKANGLALRRLKGAKSFAEVVSADARSACRAAWGIEIADMYSAAEVGYVALQCPDREQYHVQSESALVEILDEAGAPCAPGAVGRVVVTPFHNFAMPLLRYAVGDLAESGPPCSCGRGLPVLRRIMGRSKNMLVLPSGLKRFPWHASALYGQFESMIQYQLVQKSVHDLEMKLVVRRPFSPDEEDRMRRLLIENLGQDFRIVFTYHDEIRRAPSGKYFDFVSEISERGEL